MSTPKPNRPALYARTAGLVLACLVGLVLTVCAFPARVAANVLGACEGGVWDHCARECSSLRRALPEKK